MIFLLPSSVADRIRAYGGSWGSLDFRVDKRDEVLVISGASGGQKVKTPVTSSWLSMHYTNALTTYANTAFWHQADVDLLTDGFAHFLRRTPLDTQTEFRPRIKSWRTGSSNGSWYVLTFAMSDDRPVWAGWTVSQKHAMYMPVTVIDEGQSLLAPLQNAWPLDVLASLNVLLVGAGSIGSAAAEALASYGVRKLTILDPEHLEQHNFARHRLHPRVVGQNKARALRDQLLDRDPELKLTAHPINVIFEADSVRSIIDDIDVALVCSDGVASRRVMNHLVAWAKKVAVFACVIENGAFGEIVRVQPGRTGCLECDRDALLAAGMLDPEDDLDRGYLEGGGARPMTAVGGDLTLVGQLAAKIVIATHLEGHGERAQTLPGDVMTIGLRPIPDLRAPFDLEHALEVKWRHLPPSRSACLSCASR
jgi:molybdopterin/thiamine biosynthesis adenylyltransferase